MVDGAIVIKTESDRRNPERMITFKRRDGAIGVNSSIITTVMPCSDGCNVFFNQCSKLSCVRLIGWEAEDVIDGINSGDDIFVSK